MSQPMVSVVIPTHNRSELLMKVLDSLAQLTCDWPELEVVVVDDGSTDDTQARVAKRKDPFVVRVIHYPSGVGPSAARNRGAAAAQGAIIAFLDSDVLVTPDWWQAAKQHFIDPRVAAVEGATLPPPGSLPPTPFTHVVSNTRGNSFQTCNLLCRTQVFQDLGGFDERYCWRDQRGKIWHIREDADLAFAILEKKYRIVFEPQALVYHPLVVASPWVYWRETRFGIKEPLLRRKHPVMYRSYLKWIDGRAFPVFYWGVFGGAALGVLAGGIQSGGVGVMAVLAWGLGWVGSVYAVCRKRSVAWQQLVILLPQFIAIPWLRLYWVLRGEWQYRKIARCDSTRQRD